MNNKYTERHFVELSYKFISYKGLEIYKCLLNEVALNYLSTANVYDLDRNKQCIRIIVCTISPKINHDHIILYTKTQKGVSNFETSIIKVMEKEIRKHKIKKLNEGD